MTTDYKMLWNIKNSISSLSENEIGNFQQFQNFADFTRQMIIQGKMDIAERCFKLAEKTYLKGNRAVKTLLVNIFLYSLIISISYSHCENIIPDTLKSELKNLETEMNTERKSTIDEM